MSARTTRPGRLAGLLGTLIVFLALSTAAAEPIAAASPSPGSAKARNVPSTIDSTGATDASAGLNAWIASVPDGSTIVFKSGGTYRLDHGIKLSNRHHLTFNGNGATLRANGSAAVHTDTPFALWGADSYITIKNFTMIGNNSTGLFTPSQGENQMGVTIFGASNVEIANNTIKNTWGDGVYVTESIQVSGQPGTWSDNIWVHDNTFSGIGRMGIALIAVTDATFERNSFDRMSLDVLDIEPDLASEGAINVSFRNNTIGTYAHYAGYRSHLFSSCGAPSAVVRDITVSGNTVTGGRQVNANNSAGGVTARNQVSGRRSNFTFTNNTSNVSGPGYMLIFEGIDGLVMTGNVQPVTSGTLAYLANNTNQVYP